MKTPTLARAFARVQNLTLLAAAVLPISAHAGDFVDTRLVFIAGDDDLANEAGTTVPTSQLPDIGERSGYNRIFDERDSAESGRESRTHLVLYKKADGYFPGLTTEAALVMQLSHARLQTNDPRTLSDDGTFLRIEQKFGDSAARATMMPFDSDRMRLGFLWDITWAGNTVFPNSTLTPGVELEWLAPNWDVHAGAKTARLQFVTDDSDPRNGQIEAFMGVFGGLGLGNKKDGLRFDLEGGFFDKGRNPNGLVRGEKITSAGFSARLAYISGLPFEETTNTRMYSANPVSAWNKPNPFPGETRWRVAVEGTQLGQVLEDPDSTGGTTIENGYAGAAYGRLQMGATSVTVRAIYRDVAFLYFDNPGALVRYQAITKDLDQSPELTAYATVEHFLSESKLTPGISFGFQQPAAVSSAVPQAGINAPDILRGRASLIFRRADMFDDTGLMTLSFLPVRAEVEPVLTTRIHTRIDLAEGFGVQAQFTVVRDPNRVFLKQDRLNVNSVRSFDDPMTYGASIMARAEF